MFAVATACAPPTLAEVAPVVEASCVRCHRDGGEAPLSFEEAAVLADVAPIAAEHVRAGTMPPWLPGGDTPPIRDDLGLDDDLRRLLVRWFDAGAPGALGSLSPPRVSLPEADAVVSVGPYTPDFTAASDVRCFLVELPPGHLVGYRIDQDRADLVHHVLVGVYAEADRGALEARDDADPGPGWGCADQFMGSREPRELSVPVLWFPGVGGTRTYPGTGIPLSSTAVVQVHFVPGGPTGPVVPAVILDLADDDVVSERSLQIGTGDVDVEAGVLRRGFVADSLRPEWADQFGEDVWILGARGHGHGLLQRFTIEVGDQTLLDIPRWDPRWQARYVFEAPIRARRDDVLTLRCTYDPDASTDAVYGGTADDEMCGAWLFVTAARP